jgi:hypothetical protein
MSIGDLCKLPKKHLTRWLVGDIGLHETKCFTLKEMTAASASPSMISLLTGVMVA